MGYEAKKKTYKLLFTDTEMEGLEVLVKSTSMGNILEMAELDNINPQKMTRDDIQKIRFIFSILADCMISWNLDEDGSPVGHDLDGLMSQDPEFVMTIIKAWSRALTSVTDPNLGEPSNYGGQSPEQLMIPMEPLLQNQAS